MQQTPASAALGAKIAGYRKGRGWSQFDLAMELADDWPLDPTTVTRLEKGTRPLAVHELLLLAKLFGVDPAALLQTDDPLDAALADVQAEVSALTETIRVAQERLPGASADLVPLQHLVAYRKHGRKRDLDAAVGSGIMRRPNCVDILYALDVPTEEIDRMILDAMTARDQASAYREMNRGNERDN